MQQRTLYRSLVMKLEDVIQTYEEIDEAVLRNASAYRGAGSRRFSYSKSQRLKRWLSVHDLQVGFQLICYQSESSGSSVNESCAQDTEQNAAVI